MTIGFVGLGHMGGAMAVRLVQAGHAVVAYDIDAARGVDGATRATSVSEVAARSDVVFTCLPSIDAAVAVASELQGIAVHVECSTIGRAGIARVAAAHPDVPTVDAPVSGGPKGARAGTLSCLVSGAPDALARVRPLIDDLAAKVFVVGARPGDAQLAKIVNNALSICAMVVSCEAVVLGVKGGLDAHLLIDAINASTGCNSATQDKFPKAILPRTFDYGGPLGIGVKDLELYLREAEAEGLPVHVVATALAVWRDAVARLGPDVDLTALIRPMEEDAGVTVGATR